MKSAILLPARWLLPIALACLVYLAYLPGISGGLFYDDYSNLEGLTGIESREDARDFVIGGTAGPLGRPVALASFLLHVEDWPDNSARILQVNVLIHVFNAGLLFWLGYLILRLRGKTDEHTSFCIALSAAGLWAVMPLLASTSLIAVQRMTSLAALFGLLGLIAFVYGYRYQATRPHLALSIQAIGLGLGTLIAMFAKENAALIPVFALLIDALLLRQLPGSIAHVRIRRMALWLGLIAILFYLSPINRDWFAFDDYRGFSPIERLMTQSVILWRYLHLAFLPQPTAFGPFHDHVQTADDLMLPLLAISAFLLLTATAFLLRKRTVWPLFALLWFFAGHLLESTVINLELYFEHRNYLAVYGFCLMLAHVAWTARGNLARLGPVLLMLYGLLHGSILFGLTSLWGNPHAAAEAWSVRYPASSRAALHLGILDHQALGGDAVAANQSLIGFGRQAYANRGLDRAARNCPECIDVRLQALLYACTTEGEEAVQARFDDLLATAPHGRQSMPVSDGLFPLRDLVRLNACSPLQNKDVSKLILSLLRNPAFSSPTYTVRFHFVAAALADDRNEYDKVEFHLQQAETQGPAALPVLQFQVHSLIKQERFTDALAAIERRRGLVGRHDAPLMTAGNLDELAEIVRTARNEKIEMKLPINHLDTDSGPGQVEQ